ncbi:Rab geranylgeranyltransferase [Massospora cicadina]|nr:Rab geranylgeranyltransferase [Massospora cicadina]
MSLGLHGCKRVEQSAEVRLALKQKEQIQVAEYCKLCDEYAGKRRGGEYDSKMLELTYKVLMLNPDYYSAWNDRRRALEATGLTELKEELELTRAALRLRPKTYWIWNHRLWALFKMNQREAWIGELHLTDLLLNLDSRNFHGWDYRRQVIRRGAHFYRSQDSTIFSNGSAWHYRATLLTTLGLDLAKEQNLVKNAFYTDPEDQSAFLYYRWLVTSPFAPSISPPPISFPHCHVVCQLSDAGNIDITLSLTFAEAVTLVDLGVPSHPDLVLVNAWRVPTSGSSDVSRVWKSLLRVDKSRLPLPLSFSLSPKNVTTSTGKHFLHTLEGAIDKLDLKLDVQKRISYLQQEFEELQELVDLEPTAKWPLLTQLFLKSEVQLAVDTASFFMGQALNFTPDPLAFVSKCIETLAAIDPLRRGRYLS